MDYKLVLAVWALALAPVWQARYADPAILLSALIQHLNELLTGSASPTQQDAAGLLILQE